MTNGKQHATSRNEYEVQRNQVTELIALTARPQGGNHVLLHGPRGTGKSSSAAKAARKGQKVFSVTLTAEQSAAALWGHFVVTADRGTVWNDGPVLQAWREGGLLIINEVDHASEDVSNVLHVALDDATIAQVTLPTKETVRPAPGFRCIATMNGLPDDLNAAVLDRFDMTMPVNTPSEEQYLALPDDVAIVARFVYGDSWSLPSASGQSSADATASLRGYQCEPGEEPRMTYRQLESFSDKRARLMTKYEPVDAERLAAIVVVGTDAAPALVESLSIIRHRLNIELDLEHLHESIRVDERVATDLRRVTEVNHVDDDLAQDMQLTPSSEQ
jgi:Mg-chelatase subunit ChlI